MSLPFSIEIKIEIEIENDILVRRRMMIINLITRMSHEGK